MEFAAVVVIVGLSPEVGRRLAETPASVFGRRLGGPFAAVPYQPSCQPIPAISKLQCTYFIYVHGGTSARRTLCIALEIRYELRHHRVVNESTYDTMTPANFVVYFSVFTIIYKREENWKSKLQCTYSMCWATARIQTGGLLC